MSQLEIDEKFMKIALDEAKKGLYTLPNPKVGCVIVKDGQVVAKGYHEKCGEAHAEVNAITNYSGSLVGATTYVTLEPCSHHGKTPPCVDALIEAGVGRVVIAMQDPNPKVNGKGIEKLVGAGIEVTCGVLETEALELNKVFVCNIVNKRPLVYLKAAVTIDGKIATRSFDSKWISCSESRRKVHMLRGEVDAILVGKNTLMQDNPRLNVRLSSEGVGSEELGGVGVVKYPTRLILGSEVGVPSEYNIFKQEGKNIFLKDKYPDLELNLLLEKLLELGIHSILVEGGGEVFSSFLIENLVDEYLFFVCPKAVADEIAVSLFSGREVDNMKDGFDFEFLKVEKSGSDVLIIAKRR